MSTAPWADITVPGATAQTYTFVETGPAGFTSNYVITPACVDGSGATVSISALSATSFQANAALDAKLVCSFTNTANTPPVPPVLGAHKLVSSVYSSSDQFGLRVTDPSNVVLTSGATSGSLTASTSATDYKATAPLTQAIDGQTYTFSETSSTNSLGHYSAAYVCVDSTGGSANVTGTGTSTTPITVHDGQTWVCTFTNTANAHSAPVVELKKFVPNGLWNAGDVFAISVEDSAAAVVARAD